MCCLLSEEKANARYESPCSCSAVEAVGRSYLSESYKGVPSIQPAVKRALCRAAPRARFSLPPPHPPAGLCFRAVGRAFSMGTLVMTAKVIKGGSGQSSIRKIIRCGGCSALSLTSSSKQTKKLKWRDLVDGALVSALHSALLACFSGVKQEHGYNLLPALWCLLRSEP